MKFILAILFISFSTLSADMPTLVPPALHKGDLIAIVFPASFLDKGKESQDIINRKAKWLKKQGYRFIFYPQKVSVNGYLAGTDTERAGALMSAWRNNDVKAIWCFRGGYGTPRMIGLIDYEWIKNHPKIFIGMSDVTALHHAIQQETGLVTFLGPVLNYFDDKDYDFDAQYAFSEFERVLVKKKTGEIPRPSSKFETKIIRPGVAKGKVVGGNLALIASLCGTKWQLNTDNKILVLEDIGEEIFRIDRLLWQLKEAGLLDHPAGVILGSWKDCKSNMQNTLTLEEVFHHYFGAQNYPVISGFPTGHDRYQTMLPLNVMAELDTKTKTLEILEPAVQTNKSTAILSKSTNVECGD